MVPKGFLMVLHLLKTFYMEPKKVPKSTSFSKSDTEPAAYLDDRMTSSGGFDRSPAPLCLIVGSVMRLGLHVNMELVLVCMAGDRPFQRGQRRKWDATGNKIWKKGLIVCD